MLKQKLIPFQISIEKESSQWRVGLEPKQTNIKFNQLEIIYFLYPYHKELSADSFKLLPYEEYIKDLSIGNRSSYFLLDNSSSRIFGILVSLFIFVAFALFRPSELFSLQSVVALLGAYLTSREMWIDIDNFLVRISNNWLFSWRPTQFFYERENFGTIQRFWKIARKQRTGSETILASKMDFNSHSNSKTLELLFTNTDLKTAKHKKVIFSTINFTDKKQNKIWNHSAFMFGCKMSLIKKWLLMSFVTEYFQAIEGTKCGATDYQGNWKEGKFLIRNSILLGRLKIYFGSRWLEGFIIKSD